ncbi:LabA-like NYN domain-containing protein [Neokomagataea anthophila]|uniref:NYN domain-containing protein n=1 Tax=Neokomagataea anthophila TaxID=2826925 RepID=A0ABS5E4E9_9PROT|nr:NYN domain-containing protein [Neokomagataea anthophila]MBR0558767.1 NYN domain-containing protein [Neokomagataea anthophila]
MFLKPAERTALFIDGASLYHAAKNLGFDVDFRSLRDLFEKRSLFRRAYYYAAIPDTDEYSPLRPLTDWLAYNGFHLVLKTAREFTDHSGRRRIKGNMDVELAVDLLEQAPNLDHAVIISGDADLRRAVEAVQSRGVRVSVISSTRSTPPMISDDLRRQADRFIELAEIAPEFTRRSAEPRPRQAPIRHPADINSDETLPT